ncbi:MAG: DUF11 domain-containing protein, partial [Endomicrobia bacterium]|nr:DUF11 domain-containing protein [Endomicrobiia bacterium]
IKSIDDAGNVSAIDTTSPRPSARARTTWHNINCDGSLSDWHLPTERLGLRNDKGFWCTWSSTAIYFCYSNNGFNDMDLFILIDTHSLYGVELGSRSPPVWDNMQSHILPFYADYAITIEGSGYKAVREWTGTSWSVPSDGHKIASAYITDTTGNSEVAILRSAICNPEKIRVVVLHKWENARNIYNSFPVENPAPNTDVAVSFTHYYLLNLSSAQIPSESWVLVEEDTAAPSAVTNLSALAGPYAGEVTLVWSAPGDNGVSGDIVGGRYWIKYTSKGVITNWDDPPKPYYEIVISTNTSPTTIQTYRITGLTGRTTWYFALKTADECLNWSLVSNNAFSVEGFYELTVTKQVYEVTNSSRPGGEITYDIILKNVGNIKMSNVVVKDKIPDSCVYSTGTITLDGNVISDNVGFNSELNIINVNIDQLLVNEEKNLRFKVKIK